MNSQQLYQKLNLIADKQIKNIRGFYTHFAATFVILPFLVFVNLETVPQYHWFWFAFIAWFIGLVIHWISVYTFNTISKIDEWKTNTIKQLLNEQEKEYNNSSFIKEEKYLEAKKHTKKIKGFYINVFVFLFSFPIIVFVNLQFVPEFRFFWLVLGGMIIALFFHWLNVFGFDVLGLGKKWEIEKRKEIIKKYC